jgi:hypothetical protein
MRGGCPPGLIRVGNNCLSSIDVSKSRGKLQRTPNTNPFPKQYRLTGEVLRGPNGVYTPSI